ncbi:MAG: hypothetical protein JWR83_1750 [Aeromicrobium sp.]|nr:hypothetical protein [Aeromicrobium sp.]
MAVHHEAVNPTGLDWAPRFKGHPRAVAGVLVALVLLILWGALTGSRIPASAISDDPQQTDSALYGATIDRMNEGLSYYQAVAVEQPARGYPTSPPMTVREPTLAWLTHVLGDPVMEWILGVLVAAAIAISVPLYERTERGRTSWVATVCVATFAIAIFVLPKGVHVHEVWIAPLIYLGLIARGVGLTRVSVALLLFAALIRELVAPVMLIMLVLALLGRKRMEAWLWAGALAVFWAFYGLHLLRVHELGATSGSESPGWLAFGGWPFVVDAVRASSVLTVLPFWVAAVLVPVALLGWVSRAGRLFDTVSAFLVSYALLFCFVGRPDNAYWGTFLAVLLLPGIVFGVGFLLGELRGLARSRHPVLAP